MLIRGLKKKTKRFVFYDDSGKRWKKVLMISSLIFICFSIIISVVGFSLFKNPDIPQMSLVDEPIIQPIDEPLKITEREPLNFSDKEQREPYQIPNEEIYGYYLSEDTISKKTLEQNIDSLGVIIPNWYWLNSEKSLINGQEEEIIEIAQQNDVKIMPRFSLEEDTSTTILSELLNSPTSRATLINLLYREVNKDRFAGINIDFKDIGVEESESFATFMTELYETFQAKGLKVTLTVSPDDAGYDFSKLIHVTDRIIVKFFKELPALKEPGPVASLEWFQQVLNELSIPSEKLIVSLSNESYEWDMSSHKIVNCLMFHEVMKFAASSKLKAQWDPSSRNPYLSYKKDNVPHLIWFLDATTSYNQIKLALTNDVKGFAIEQLGYEDPGIWKIISDTSQMELNARKLESMENPIEVLTIGSGEFIRLSGHTQQGKRTIQLDDKGYIAQEEYELYPLPYYIEKYGEPQEKWVVLSFDDGPDPTYTPEILEILSKEKVRATFYVVGRQVALYPNILQRIYLEGHEIGNHTFSHSDIKKDSPWMLQAELNSTQRLIQQITGHSTNIYRPPYTVDLEADTVEELNPYLRVQNMGYTMVGAYIDPKDWQGDSAENIVSRLLENLPEGNVVLLHDAGGNREATVKALPEIINTLKNEGYEFVTAADLIQNVRSDIMPPVEEETFPYMFFYKIANSLFNMVIDFCKFFFMFGIAFGIVRLLMLFTFSFRHNQRIARDNTYSRYRPFVSVVIPAFNEEKVIEKTLSSILKSSYRNYEIIVINDGSTDRTNEIVRKIARESRIPVRHIVKANGGKTAAINHGVLKSRGEIIVTLDADTSISKEAISLLVKHFRDERVAGVSGNVRIGNIRNIITIWQHIEYVTGFNLEKRAFHELNCITVVPGAIGALRKSAILEVGSFEEDTLAEDTDITLKLLRKGYRIHYEPNALAYTEAPEDAKALIKQRFRWSYGILQCLRKHVGALFNTKQKGLGFIGMPYMWLQYIFQAFAPLIDIVFFIGLFGDTPKIVTYYILFFLVDVLVTFYAFKLEKISTKPLLHLIIQRIIYRQLLTFTIWKAFIFAARGVLIGWNKLIRSGNVKVP